MWENNKIWWIWVKCIGVTYIILAAFLEVKLFQNKVIFQKSASWLKYVIKIPHLTEVKLEFKPRLIWLNSLWGTPGWLSQLHVGLRHRSWESGDWVPHEAPCSAGEPASPSALTLPLAYAHAFSDKWINKILKKNQTACELLTLNIIGKKIPNREGGKRYWKAMNKAWMAF